ncbi:hypothetical protein THAOC_02356, partial [Thalassiosira oceanica]
MMMARFLRESSGEVTALVLGPATMGKSSGRKRKLDLG